jgi:hypothetical protein
MIYGLWSLHANRLVRSLEGNGDTITACLNYEEAMHHIRDNSRIESLGPCVVIPLDHHAKDWDAWRSIPHHILSQSQDRQRRWKNMHERVTERGEAVPRL